MRTPIRPMAHPTMGSPKSDPDSKSDLDNMFEENGILDLLKDDADCPYSKPGRSQLWKMLKQCYSVVCSLTSATITEEELLVRLQKQQEERLSQFQTEIQVTIQESLKQSLKQHQAIPTYAQLAADPAAPHSPVRTPLTSRSAPMTLPSQNSPPSPTWRKIVVDCHESDTEEIHKLSEQALSKSRVSRLDKKKNAVVVTVPESDREKVANALSTGLQNKAVRVRSEPTSKLTILNVPVMDNIAEIQNKSDRNTAILSMIREKNEELAGAEVDVVFFKTNRHNPELCSVGIRLPTPLKRKILNQRVLYVGYTSCKVVDRVHVIQCYKCQGFHHTADSCVKDTVCGFCAGNHMSKDCNVKSSSGFIPTCPNCSITGKDCVSHVANSFQCPIYKEKYDYAVTKNQ